MPVFKLQVGRRWPVSPSGKPHGSHASGHAVAIAADILLALLAGVLAWTVLISLAVDGPLGGLLANLRAQTPISPIVFGEPPDALDLTEPFALPVAGDFALALLAALSMLLRGQGAGRTSYQAAVLGAMFLAEAHAWRLQDMLESSHSSPTATTLSMLVALVVLGQVCAALSAPIALGSTKMLRRQVAQVTVACVAVLVLWVVAAAMPVWISWGKAATAQSSYVGPAVLFGALMFTLLTSTRAQRLAEQAASHAELDAANALAEAARRDRDAAEAQLQALRSQVEPHFLWNTLANLDQMIRTRHAGSQAMAHHLQTFLRQARPQARGQPSTLGAECDAVHAYLSLLQLRTGARLQFDVKVDDTSRHWRFPPLVLQTLVENAVVHGLEPRAGVGHVSVRVTRADHDQLLLEVADDGVGLLVAPVRRGTGIGLRSARAALRECLGETATLALQSGLHGGTRALLKFPAVPV